MVLTFHGIIERKVAAISSTRSNKKAVLQIVVVRLPWLAVHDPVRVHARAAF
jgi:hypothetical protein